MSFLAVAALAHGLVTTRLNYTFEGLEYEGYVAQPSHVARAVHDQGPLTSHNELLPIALVVHGMDGEGEIEQFRADQLAHLGFIAFAVDLFGKDKRPHGDFIKGQEYVTLAYSDMARLHRQLAAQVEALTATFPIADAANFIVAGSHHTHCFGGNIALEYARGAFPRLRAAVSFHGTFGSAPASPIVVAPLSAAVQLHHADDDFQDMDLSSYGGAWGGGDDSGDDAGSWGGGADNSGDAGSWGVRRLLFATWGGGGAMARKGVSVLTEVENGLRDAGAERWMTIRYGKVGHAWTYPTSDEYKEFEAVNAHAASYALYRQLGLVTDGLAGTPCAAEGVAC